MDDLISRQAAIETADFECGEWRGLAGTIINGLKNLPAVDAISVVRCRDCKYSEHWYRDKRRCFLWDETGIGVFEDGYCNYAERREK